MASKAAPKFQLRFTDGEDRVVTRRPVHLWRAETLTGSDAGQNFYLLAVLWAADTGGKGKLADFEKWVDTLEDWERLDPEEIPNPPAEPGTSQT